MKLHLLLLVIPLAAAAMSCAAAPDTPASGAQIVTALPRHTDPQWQALRALRGQLAADPRNAALAAHLAQRYIALGRALSDPRLYGQAQAALAPWWTAAAPPAPVRLLRATLRQTAHRYPEALADLLAITASDPGHAQAWLTLATVQTVTGNPVQATASCARLAAIADELATAACLAGAAATADSVAASERLLGMALARAGRPPPAVVATVAGASQAIAPEQWAWAQTVWAELAGRRGDSAAAETRFRAALAGAPAGTYLLAAYADFLLARQRPADALALLDARARPDALLLRRALALQQLRQAARLSGDVAELSARFAAARWRGDRVHQREQAMFTLHLLGDARGALALALENWAVQKDLADARIVLQAALAARDAAAARPVLHWLARTGVYDQTLQALARQIGNAT